MLMKKEQEFKKLIEEKFSNPTIVRQLNNVRYTMSTRREFNKLSAEIQFEFCFTICVIATQTARQDLSCIQANQNQFFEYSINRQTNFI
jgi:hypothetical protein